MQINELIKEIDNLNNDQLSFVLRQLFEEYEHDEIFIERLEAAITLVKFLSETNEVVITKY